jgi:hypothetical protein
VKGIFLLALDENDLDIVDEENNNENDKKYDKKNEKYLIKWMTQLDIGDVDIICKEDKIRDSIKEEKVPKFKDIFN